MGDYFLGLNMSTKAVGWCITDPQYNLLRKRGKDLWGVRLFDEANSCQERRSMRISRRMKQRRKDRIDYVKKTFADAINKVDPDFYSRLNDSFYHMEDKSVEQPYSLFADPDYTDKEYYEQYPTIFHLRSELIHSDEPHDVRLVYLAVLNIFKHRGNFLSANLSSDDEMPSFESIYAEIVDRSINLTSSADVDGVKAFLASDNISDSRRSDEIADILGITKKLPEAGVIKLMCGLKGTLSKIFPEHTFDEETKKYSLSFRDSDYEDKEEQMRSFLNDEEFEYITLIKQAHDWGVLANIMKGEEYISDGMVISYEKHKADLALIKLLYKKYDPKSYNAMFRTMGKASYSSYVGSVNSDLEKARRSGDPKKDEELFKKLIADVTKMETEHPDDVDVAFVLDELKNGTFLPKQRTKNNSVIPYQVNLRELKKILANAKNYLPFLNKVDDTGLDASERLIQLFSFQIPYYIGPLYNDGKHNAWVVRKEMGKVYPWNFEQKVDVKASSEAFIQNLVGECTYLPGEKVLPKCSLLYEKYMVLNEINKLRVNGAPISPDVKKGIFNDLFCRYKKVTLKRVADYLIKQGYYKKEDIADISGIGDEFSTSLKNRQKWCEIFGTKTLTYAQEQIAEKVIYWSTIYGDARSMLKEQVEQEFGDIFNDVQIHKICMFRVQGWGKLSEAFLKLIGEKMFAKDDRPLTLIDRMWEENVNVMECLGTEYTYLDAVQSADVSSTGRKTDIEYEDLRELYISAPVRRMLWQTIQVIRELVGVMGHDPKRIFIEVDKDADMVNKNQRASNRKEQLLALYKKHKDKRRDWVKEITDIQPVSRFLSKRLYLYYMQQGRCMLTGEPIRLEELFDDERYNIDHIYPKQLVVDENIEKNLILVSTNANRKKGNIYPLSPQIRGKQFSFWKKLCSEGFITKEKYERLIRSTPFTDDELAAFIGSQTTDTRQGTKVITNLCRRSFPETEVCHVRASAVSNFRQQFKLLRCSDLNNLWRAQDSYLNIVVGNCLYVKFTKSPINYIRNSRNAPQKNKYHMGKIFAGPIERDGETAWDTEENKTIETVRVVMSKVSPLTTMMNYTRHGALWKRTFHSAKKAGSGTGYIPVKSTDERLLDMSKYGGYSNYAGAYFFLVEHTKKNRRIRTIETMPLYMMDKCSTEKEILDYCTEALGYTEPVIRIPKIKLYSLAKVNGYYVYLTGRTLNRLSIRSAVEPKFSEEMSIYVKRIFSTADINESEQEYDKQPHREDISRENNMALYRYLAEKNTTGIFAKKPGSFGKRLASPEWENAFAALSINHQVSVLRQIILYDSGKTNTADLSQIGGSPNTGSASLGKDVNSYDQFLLISKSPTGLFERITDLQTV